MSWEASWHGEPECRNLYHEYRCGHNEVTAIIGHRLCRHCNDGKICEPQGMQDYLFDNDDNCDICQNEEAAELDEIARQRVLWAIAARQTGDEEVRGGITSRKDAARNVRSMSLARSCSRRPCGTISSTITTTTTSVKKSEPLNWMNMRAKESSGRWTPNKSQEKRSGGGKPHESLKRDETESK